MKTAPLTKAEFHIAKAELALKRCNNPNMNAYGRATCVANLLCNIGIARDVLSTYVSESCNGKIEGECLSML